MATAARKQPRFYLRGIRVMHARAGSGGIAPGQGSGARPLGAGMVFTDIQNFFIVLHVHSYVAYRIRIILLTFQRFSLQNLLLPIGLQTNGLHSPTIRLQQRKVYLKEKNIDSFLPNALFSVAVSNV
jgi:hypothetical protein